MRKIFTFLCVVLMLTWVTLAYAKLEFNPVTGRLDKTSLPGTVISFDPSDYGGINWGDADLLTPFNWGWNSGATKPNITFGDGTMDFYNTVLTIHGTKSEFGFANNMFINGDTARKLKVGSTGGTTNEDILLDNDSTANTIALSSTTGADKLDFGTFNLRTLATSNWMGNVSIGTFNTPTNTISAAGNVSIGTAYAIARVAPANGMAVQGNVGIGTWLPTTAMQVVGTITATNFASSSATEGAIDLFEAAANGTNKISISAPAAITSDVNCALENDSTPFDQCITAGAGSGTIAAGVTGAIPKYTASTTVDDSPVLFEGGGNIGIGTTGPIQALQVVGTVAATAFTGDGSGLTGIVAGGWTDGGSNVYPSTTSDNVGIGTTTPTQKLTLAGSMTVSASTGTVDLINAVNNSLSSGNALDISSSSSSQTVPLVNLTQSGNASGTVLTVTQSGSSSSGSALSVSQSGTSSTARAATISNLGTSDSFYVTDQSSDGTPFVINSAGNVGIGTTTPASPFSVYGATITQRITGANTACSTTCGALACYFGQNTADFSIVDCADATADVCTCSK